MIAFLLALLHRHRPEQAPAVKDAKQRRDAQFSEWDNVMREVDRVQKVVKAPRQTPRGQH
jgi:hypothetical protein